MRYRVKHISDVSEISDIAKASMLLNRASIDVRRASELLADKAEHEVIKELDKVSEALYNAKKGICRK